MNYYNEIDPKAAQWLRNLISAGHIAPGDVDERSIEDVRPDELRGYTQHHFFAGIGGWPLALDIAGWPRDRPVFTGSCPCQSFSVAGKGAGFADKRHLWPAWFHLIRELAPTVVFGEQVAAAIRFGWLDLVSADLEGAGYAIGSAVLGAHSVGAPHIRQRLYFVANVIAGRQGCKDNGRRDPRGHAQPWAGLGSGGSTDKLADASGNGAHQIRRNDGEVRGIPTAQREPEDGAAVSGRCGGADILGNAGSPRLAQQFGERGTPRETDGRSAREAAERAGASVGAVVQSDRDGSLARDSATTPAGHGRSTESASFWSGAEWIGCRDGKARPVEPKYVKMVDGISDRMVPERSNSGAPEEVNGQTKIAGAPFLRSGVHGEVDGGTDKGSRREGWPQAIEEGGDGFLRDMRKVWTASCSSQGREPDEQCPGEFDDFVRLLPSSRAFAELHGDRETSEALLALCKASGADRLLQHASYEVEEIWRSLGKEIQNRFWLEVRKGGFVKAYEAPLAHGVSARVVRLRAYGNAIVPQTAAAFIVAYMDCERAALTELAGDGK